MYLAWSRGTPPLLGLAFAAESQHLFTWADPPRLALWHGGRVVAERQGAEPLLAGTCAGDGAAFAVASTSGRLWLLNADLRTIWERQLAVAAVGLGLDPLGDLLAVSDTAGGLLLLDAANGREVWRVETARPLRHLAFVPERPLLVGAAETGLVAAFDPAGTCVWQHGLAAFIGSLAVPGDGSRIVLAGHGEGPICFDAAGARVRALTHLGPCRRLALSYDGRLVLCENGRGQLVVATSGGVELSSYTPPGKVAGLAFAPLGDRVLVGLREGGLHELTLQRDDGKRGREP